MAVFEEDGIQFQYPENWTMQREENENGWTVTLQSPETAFLMISIDADMPEMEAMAQTALDVLKEEYQEVESENCVETVAGQPAIGHDVRFFSLDLTNTCWIRSFCSDGGTVLVMWQVNDLELEQYEAVLRAICVSIKLEDD
jgi:hypothetical protein